MAFSQKSCMPTYFTVMGSNGPGITSLISHQRKFETEMYVLVVTTKIKQCQFSIVFTSIEHVLPV